MVDAPAIAAALMEAVELLERLSALPPSSPPDLRNFLALSVGAKRDARAWLEKHEAADTIDRLARGLADLRSAALDDAAKMAEKRAQEEQAGSDRLLDLGFIGSANAHSHAAHILLDLAIAIRTRSTTEAKNGKD